MKEIRGDAKNIQALLGNARYAIDYYQREYRWETKQITELINDLTEKFGESHEEGNERSAVEGYGHYFLGSIIISDKDGHKYIIDGQQRLTSLTLLLIYVYRNLEDTEQQGQIAKLIYSLKRGERSFNLDVEERTPCMEALFKGDTYDEDGQPESVVNILHRYQDIAEHFPDELGGDTLPFFADWLIENVHLVEITAYSDADAYTIFETMNDRGLSLSPTDMLKGYLLANITDTSKRTHASATWRARINALQDIGKEEDADAIKAWLRSQHAETVRERKRGAVPRDFDLIGTEFHRWVKDHQERLSLQGSADFARLIEEDFAFYTRWYERLRRAALTLTPGLEAVYYNAQNNFTLQYPLLLAPLRRGDGEADILRKIRITAGYVDILIARRIWNWRSTAYSTMQYVVFLVMKEIRGVSAGRLAEVLLARLEEEAEQNPFHGNFYWHGMNGKLIHRLLARMTDYVEVRSGRDSKYDEYIRRGGKHGYEVEHVLANHYEQHQQEFESEQDFEDHRNQIGGLLLLQKSFNASFGDMPYGDKREHYYGQNLLARSLHERAYENDPAFRRFVEASGLPFRPLPSFGKADINERQELYKQLAERVWSPENLRREVMGTSGAEAAHA